MEKQSNTLKKVRASATRAISALPDEFVYHNLKFFKRLTKKISEIAQRSNLSHEDTESVLIAAWMLGVLQTETYIEIQDQKFIFKIPEESYNRIKILLSKYDYPEKKTEKVLKLLKESVSLSPNPQYEWERVFLDALASDYAGKNGGKRLEQTYRELLSRNVELSKKNWHKLILDYFSQIEYYTEYGKEQIKPAVLKMMKEVIKDKKQLQKEDDFALKKELNLEDEEYKKLKKSLLSVKGRDERGIQTLFRTTSKNQYTLNDMVDRKANIMITVNSIILSLLVGGVIGKEDFQDSILFIPPTMLALSSIFSIFFCGHGYPSQQNTRYVY